VLITSDSHRNPLLRVRGEVVGSKAVLRRQIAYALKRHNAFEASGSLQV
jgi:hypothetical protein